MNKNIKDHINKIISDYVNSDKLSFSQWELNHYLTEFAEFVEKNSDHKETHVATDEDIESVHVWHPVTEIPQKNKPILLLLNNKGIYPNFSVREYTGFNCTIAYNSRLPFSVFKAWAYVEDIEQRTGLREVLDKKND